MDIIYFQIYYEWSTEKNINNTNKDQNEQTNKNNNNKIQNKSKFIDNVWTHVNGQYIFTHPGFDSTIISFYTFYMSYFSYDE